MRSFQWYVPLVSGVFVFVNVAGLLHFGHLAFQKHVYPEDVPQYAINERCNELAMFSALSSVAVDSILLRVPTEYETALGKALQVVEVLKESGNICRSPRTDEWRSGRMVEWVEKVSSFNDSAPMFPVCDETHYTPSFLANAAKLAFPKLGAMSENMASMGRTLGDLRECYAFRRFEMF